MLSQQSLIMFREQSPRSDSSATAQSPTVPSSQSPKKSRAPRQAVSIACVHCKKAHLACDEERPCRRCVRVGRADTCVDHIPKKRGRPALSQVKRDEERRASLSSMNSHHGYYHHGHKHQHHSYGQVPFPTSLARRMSETQNSMDMLAQLANQESNKTRLASPPYSVATYSQPSSTLPSALYAPEQHQLTFRPLPGITDHNSFRHTHPNKSMQQDRMPKQPAMPLPAAKTTSQNSSSVPTVSVDKMVMVIEAEKLAVAHVSVSSTALANLYVHEHQSLYDVVHPLDRTKLSEFHRDLVSGSQNSASHCINLHLRTRIGPYEFCTIQVLSSGTANNNKAHIQLAISKYEHPVLACSTAPIKTANGLSPLADMPTPSPSTMSHVMTPIALAPTF